MNVCLTVTFTPSSLKKPGVSESMFLQRHEEDVLFRHYERRLLEFCNAFKPTMPKSVVVCMYVCMHACGFFEQSHVTSRTSVNHVPFSRFAGYSPHVLQEILPEQLRHGVPPQDYHVSTAGR